MKMGTHGLQKFQKKWKKKMKVGHPVSFDNNGILRIPKWVNVKKEKMTTIDWNDHSAPGYEF